MVESKILQLPIEANIRALQRFQRSGHFPTDTHRNEIYSSILADSDLLDAEIARLNLHLEAEFDERTKEVVQHLESVAKTLRQLADIANKI